MSLRTTYLGQFDDAHAEQIAGALERAGIAWSHKRASRLTQFFFAGEWGVRMFVDAGRVEEARAIVGGLDHEAPNQETQPPTTNPEA